MQRFVREIEAYREHEILNDFNRTAVFVISKMVQQDTFRLLLHLHEALDEIDLSLAHDEKLHSCLRTWRERLGRWRKDLLSLRASIGYICKVIDGLLEHPSPETPLKEKGRAEQLKCDLTTLRGVELKDLGSQLDDVQKRVESSFQLLMSTMSIVESHKAIKEAETVSKLTSLAFFFIPLTFVASIFGMNIVVSMCRAASSTHANRPGIRQQCQGLDLGCALSFGNFNGLHLPLLDRYHRYRAGCANVLSELESQTCRGRNRCESLSTGGILSLQSTSFLVGGSHWCIPFRCRRWTMEIVYFVTVCWYQSRHILCHICPFNRGSTYRILLRVPIACLGSWVNGKAIAAPYSLHTSEFVHSISLRS